MIGLFYMFLEVCLLFPYLCVRMLFTSAAAHKLVDSSTSYVYDSRTQTYLQPSFSNQLLQRVMTVNKKALDSLLLSQTVSFDKRPPVPAGTPLSQLVNVATSETHLAPFILSILFEELGKQESFVSSSPLSQRKDI